MSVYAEASSVVHDQEQKYGPFTPDVAGVRLALAVLQDEVTEALGAWRDERRDPHWIDTRCEVMQVAAVALRLVEAIDRASEPSGE